MQTATEAFLTAADGWLSDEDSPAVATLRMAAEQLDKDPQSAMLSTYNRTYQALLKRKPKEAPQESALEKALREAAESDARPATNDAQMTD